MKKIHLLLLGVTLCLFSACHNDIWDAIDGLDGRVTKLEEVCKEMNTNITSLQTIVDVLQSNDFITPGKGASGVAVPLMRSGGPAQLVGSGVRALLIPSLCCLCLNLQDSSGTCLRGLLEGLDDITYLKHLARHLARKSHYYRTFLSSIY